MSENKMLDAATWYRDIQGWSVIPVGRDKRPVLPEWKSYQNRKATDAELRDWWGGNGGVSNGIGIVCGSVSNLTVIDIDRYKPEGERSYDAIKGILGTISTPGVVSPRGGIHVYITHTPQLESCSRSLPGCEIQGNGHYVVAPPSVGQNHKAYTWKIKPSECKPAILSPNQVGAIINAGFNTSINSVTKEEIYCNQRAKMVLSFDAGLRDESLFSVANALIKGGMDESNVLYVLENLAKSCNPPLSEKYAAEKVKSAMERAKDKDRNLTEELREWLKVTSGLFKVTNVYKELGIVTKSNMTKARVILGRLEKEGLIVHGKNHGEYRVINSECEKIEWWNASDKPFDLKLPLGLNDLVEVFSRNLIVVAGEFDAGKTALLLNIAEMNMRDKPVWYFSSEMDGNEMKKRIRGFEYVKEEDFRHINFFQRTRDFQDVIHPDDINIIDYFEIGDNFFSIGDAFMQIYERLRKGVAIIALQKKMGVDMGRGAEFSAEKPRLYLSISKIPGQQGQRLKIVKAKGWKNPGENPNYKSIDFKIVRGCELKPTSFWEFKKS